MEYSVKLLITQVSKCEHCQVEFVTKVANFYISKNIPRFVWTDILSLVFFTGDNTSVITNEIASNF